MSPADSGSTFIAWWGAGLSTILALIKLGELWRDRFRIDVSYNFRGAAEEGNDVHVRNLTGRPMILTYWELLYGSGMWPRRAFEPLRYPDMDDGDIRIEPHSTRTLSFSDDQHFDWGQKARNGKTIWIRLHIAGRRPILKLVYPS